MEQSLLKSSNNLSSYVHPIFLGSGPPFISWWNLSPCSSLASPKFSWKQSMWLYIVHLNTHVTPKGFEIVKHIIYQFNAVFSFIFAEKISDNCTKWGPGFSISLIQQIYKDKILNELSYLWVIKYILALIFCLLNYIHKRLKQEFPPPPIYA